jgi:cytidylate kinase
MDTPNIVALTNSRVVAVDGGTATGKSRLVEELAAVLRLKGVAVMHVSSGHLYRAVAYVGLESVVLGVPKRGKTAAEVTAAALERLRLMDAETLLRLSRERRVEMHGGAVWIDGVAASVDEQIKGPGMGTGSSVVSRLPEVRQFVNALLRRQINEFDGYVLIDGRDIGHGVVPDAPLKLLLTVSPAVAAQRSHEHTIDEIIERDEADKNRQHGPLMRPENAGETMVVMSTDDHTPESARDHVYGLMRRTFAELPEL